MYHSSEHICWRTIKVRCYNPKNASYPNYGGRGIFMCERWRESFENFYADVGPKPSAEYTLDRIDNSGPYAPENCRWITRQQQSLNTRRNHLLTFDGETKPISEWSKSLGFPQAVIGKRLKRGWSVKEALTLPLSARHQQGQDIASVIGVK
jgi:hypothetical protein